MTYSEVIAEIRKSIPSTVQIKIGIDAWLSLMEEFERDPQDVSPDAFFKCNDGYSILIQLDTTLAARELLPLAIPDSLPDDVV